MGAADATLTDALALLRTQWATETEGVLSGKYSFWLGSGISRERYPDVPGLIRKLLDLLQAGIDRSDAQCPYRRALETVLELTTANGVDVTRPPIEWPKLQDIIAQLRDQYSKALDVDLRVAGAAKELFWDVLKLQDLYGDPSVAPDAEHRFLALLVEEGIVSELVTTNWDPLIELASEACRPSGVQTLRTVACGKEVDGSKDAGARLLKVHGCARKALQNPGTYKVFLVATETHIDQWSNGDLKRPFRELAHTILREGFAFFIGLSGQDHNLHCACIVASLGRESFPTNPSRVLFAAASIGASQRSILKAIYGCCYSDHADEIDAKAALPLYAKPLLGSLYVLGLERKVFNLLQNVPIDFTPVHRALVERAIARIEASVCERYDRIADSNTRWRQLADEVPSIVSRFLSIYRRQETPPTPEAYECFSNQNPSQMVRNPIIPESLPWLFLALALIVEGELRSMWTAKPCAGGGENGQLAVEMTGRSVRVFVIDSGETGMAKLVRNGFTDARHVQRAVVVHPSEKEPRLRRRGSPRRPMPGRRVEEPLEVWLRDIIDDGQTLDEIVKEFQRKLAT